MMCTVRGIAIAVAMLLFAQESANTARAAEKLAADIRTATKASIAAVPIAAQRIRNLAESGEFRLLGFSGPAEGQTATLQSPLPVYEVYLDELRQFDPQRKSAIRLMHPVGEVMYLVVRPDGSVASRVVVAKSEESWQTVSMGSVEQAKRVFNLLSPRDVAASNSSGEVSRFLLEVPALHVVFLGTLSTGTLPTVVGPQLQLTVVTSAIPAIVEGQSAPADEMFKIIREVAKSVPDLPS